MSPALIMVSFDLPLPSFNERMPDVMFWIFCILTEATQLPFIWLGLRP
jgi:hypothetical protein